MFYRLLLYFANCGVKGIYLDVPYPVDKARIFGIISKRKEIKKGIIYNIIRHDDNNYVFDNTNNDIHVNCNKFNLARNIIFYGDGEGAFKVYKYSENAIQCIALNEFYIINGKSLSCGFNYSSKDLFIQVIKYIGDMNVKLLIPFVENVDEIRAIRSMIGENVKLIAKIETDQGIDKIKEITSYFDEILIGRGDLVLYSNLKNLLPRLTNSLHEVKHKNVIFCTGILQNLCDTYLPERAEIFDLLLIKQLNANKIILSGSADLNANKIEDMYEKCLKAIKRKIELIDYVW